MPLGKRFLPFLLAFFLVVLIVLIRHGPDLLTGTKDGNPGEATQQDLDSDPNIRFGMPGPAGKERESYRISRPQYTLSYNGKTHNPNWVSWRLRHEDIGKSVRGAFTSDPLLPNNIAKVPSSVYSDSGFDRGHMCAAQDRSSAQEDMDATFFTTNIVPQAPHCNQRAWERLEHYSRGLTKDGHVLWITCGPAGVGGEGKDGRKDEIGKGAIKVEVPAKVWKVILVLPREDAMPTRQSRTIGVILPNNQSPDYDWAKYRVSVSEVEKLTGFNFWPAIGKETAQGLKEKVDEVEVKAPKGS